VPQTSRLTRRQFFRAVVPNSPPPDAQTARSTRPFFRQNIRAIPTLNANYWSFSVGGLVRHPLVWSYSDVLALPQVEFPCAVACIGNKPGGEWIGDAVWQGTPLTEMLNELTILPEARYARLLAADKYVTSLPLDRLQGALLVYGMNGDVLPPEHGFPMRLMVPGLYGYKMPKWIERIELTDTPAGGIWEERGWSADGTVQTTSAILSPRSKMSVSGTVQFTGIAYAGERAITAIELSIDGGPWMPVQFTPVSGAGWTEWQIEWTPPGPGDYQVRVRATDSDGFTQPESGAAFPNGASGQHAIVVRLTEQG
jgi:DMSO/TMAO reductase YedYZ molybdopterin-dependent catalytic subunit